MRGGLLLVLSLGLLYGLTLCPTVPGGDSGELITVAANLGVAHPPGYPLYIMLGHIFSYWPWGSIAFRINMMSAVFSILTAVGLFILVRHWLKNSVIALITALSFSVSPLVWRYSVVAEVFTLNNFFSAILLLFYYRFLETQDRRSLFGVAFIFGLACSHHHTVLFLAIPLFIWTLLFYREALLRPQIFLTCLVLFALGLLPYAYLFVAPEKGALFSWGNITTFQDLATHFLRQEYGTFQLASGDHESHFLINLWLYGKNLFEQSFGLLLLPLILTLWPLIREKNTRSEFYRTLLFCYVFGVLTFNALANIDLSVLLYQDVQSRFWITPLLLYFLLGAGALSKMNEMEWGRRKHLPLLLCAVAIPVQMVWSYRKEDQSKNFLFYDLGKSIVGSLPSEAVVLLRGDVYVNAVRYVQDVEGFRQDVQAIPLDLLWWPWMKGKINSYQPKIKVPGETIGLVKSNSSEYTLADFIRVNQSRFSVLSTKLLDPEMKLVERENSVYSLGLLNLFEKKDMPVSLAMRIPWFDSFDKFEPPSVLSFRKASWEAFVYYNYWDREFARIFSLMTEASQQHFSQDYLVYLAKRFKFIFSQDVEPPAHIYKNAGLTYQFLVRQGQNHYLPNMITAWEKYLKVADSKSDPEVPKIRALLEQLQGS